MTAVLMLTASILKEVTYACVQVHSPETELSAIVRKWIVVNT